MMFVGFDIGNTSTMMGVYRDDSPVPVRTFRFKSDRSFSADEVGALAKGFLDMSCGCDRDSVRVSGLAFSSVVTELNPVFRAMSVPHFGADIYEITSTSRLSIRINYGDPSELGVDRIVNAEAAFREYGGGCVIIDIGTAATFCVLLEDGVFDGGMIAPGIGTTISALSEKTSRLPKIEFGRPDRLVARDTVNALKSGFFYGWISLVEGIVFRIEAEYGRRFRVVLTGGYSGEMAPHIGRETILDPLLTMKGIWHVYRMNRGG